MNSQPLVNPDKVLLPHLHIKFDLKKTFVEAIKMAEGFSLVAKEISKDNQGQNQRRNICGPSD